MMSKNSIVPFLKDYLIKFLTRPFLLDTNDSNSSIFDDVGYKADDDKSPFNDAVCAANDGNYIPTIQTDTIHPHHTTFVP